MYNGARDLDYGCEINQRLKAIIKVHNIAEFYNIPVEIRQLFDGWEVCYPCVDACIISISQITGFPDPDTVEIMDERERMRYLTVDEAVEALYRYHRYTRLEYKP